MQAYFSQSYSRPSSSNYLNSSYRQSSDQNRSQRLHQNHDNRDISGEIDYESIPSSSMIGRSEDDGSYWIAD